MSQADQELYGRLLESLETLRVKDQDDLASLRLIWQRRYREVLLSHSDNRENLNNHLTEIESAFHFLASIDVSEISRVATLLGYFKSVSNSTPQLDINACIGVSTASIFRSENEYILSLNTIQSPEDLYASSLLRAIEKAIGSLKYRSSKGTWGDSKLRGFKVNVRTESIGGENDTLPYEFWFNLWLLLRRSSHYIYAIKSSSENNHLYALAESDGLLNEVGIPSLRDWLCNSDPLKKEFFGLDDLSFALPSPFSEYCLSLGRGCGIPMNSLDSDDFSLPSDLYDGFIDNIFALWDKYQEMQLQIKEQEKKEAQRIAEEKEAQRINQLLRVQRINQQQKAWRIHQQREAQRLAEEQEAQPINQQPRAKQINHQRSARQNAEEEQRNLISDELIGAIGVLMLFIFIYAFTN